MAHAMVAGERPSLRIRYQCEIDAGSVANILNAWNDVLLGL